MSAPKASPVRRVAVVALTKKPEPPEYLHAPQNRRQRRVAARILRRAAHKMVGTK